MDLRTMTNREEEKTFWMIPELVEILLSFLGSRVHPDPCLGTGDGTKTDEFSEKFQTAFDPPLIFGKLYCGFRDKIVTKVHMFIMAGLLCII